MKLLPVPFLATLLVPFLAGAATGIGSFQYLSPIPGSTMHRPETNIIIRHGELIDSSTVSDEEQIDVTGSTTGAHYGAWLLSDDIKTLVFNPSLPFAVGEQVNVFLHSGIRTMNGAEIGSVAFSFAITPSNIHLAVDEEVTVDERPSLANQPSVLDSLPSITLLHSDNPSPGCIFISNIVLNTTIPNTPYLIVVDNTGTPIASHMTGVRSYDFKMQPNGTMTYYRSNISRHIVLDTAFQVLDTIGIRNGYNGALHELHILPNGHALILGVDPQTIRMDTIVPGGNSAARVAGAIIQEMDRSKNVVFQWRSWDSFRITDATHENLTAPVVDYSHPNAFDVDTDGNLLVSSRHMDEITKISRITGRIMWRLGGRDNEFTFVNDTLGFSYQHAVRRIPNGHITLFDNGNYHTPQFSRAVE